MPSLAPYTASVRAVQINRGLIALGFLGLFIAGTLTLAKAMHVVLPCGAGGGEGSCQAVSEHPTAFWFGIPVAYFGLAGYLAITALAIVRELTGRELSRPLVGLGFVMSAFGFLASLYLQYTALFVIHEVCKWCISSALTMFATFIGHAWLFNIAANADAPLPDLPTPSRAARVRAVPFLVAGLLATGVAAFAVPKTDAGGPKVVEAKLNAKSELIPFRHNELGPATAPVTVVEFADFCCPSCRATAMSTRALVGKYPGKVRLVFRHFPLVGKLGHEMAFPLAIVSELAADRGKFWPFHEAVMTSKEPPATKDEVTALARNVGLDSLEVAKIIDAGPSPQYDVVYRDFQEANALGAPGTPTFFVVAPGQKPRIVQSSALDEEFATGEFSKYVH